MRWIKRQCNLQATYPIQKKIIVTSQRIFPRNPWNYAILNAHLFRNFITHLWITHSCQFHKSYKNEPTTGILFRSTNSYILTFVFFKHYFAHNDQAFSSAELHDLPGNCSVLFNHCTNNHQFRLSSSCQTD